MSMKQGQGPRGMRMKGSTAGALRAELCVVITSACGRLSRAFHEHEAEFFLYIHELHLYHSINK